MVNQWLRRAFARLRPVACAAGALAMLSNDVHAQTRTAAQAERERRTETARAARLRNEAAPRGV